MERQEVIAAIDKLVVRRRELSNQIARLRDELKSTETTGKKEEIMKTAFERRAHFYRRWLDLRNYSAVAREANRSVGIIVQAINRHRADLRRAGQSYEE